jgi:hypothetical protein
MQITPGQESGYQVLQRREVFDFRGTEDLAEELVHEYRGMGADEDTSNFTRDLVCLSAAEFSLMPLITRPSGSVLPLQSPIAVPPEAVRIAAGKVDCSYMDVHRRKEKLENIRLWDVMLFAGDMSKIELLGSQELTLEDLETTVQGLEERYQRSESSVGRAIGESGVLRIQGLLWKAKLALHIDPREYEGYVDQYLERLPLSEPATAGSEA